MMRGVTDSSQSGLTDTLRWSYLMTLPFFNTVAILSNVLIVCMFSVEKMKKYRASVFFRYLALVDMASSLLVFGLMWLSVVLPGLNYTQPERIFHCRTYTVFRYTVQDLSAWGLVCLVMERCSQAVTKSPRPPCLVFTVCKYQWVVRHLPSKFFLLSVSVLTVVINAAMVFSVDHELDVSVMTECFNTWKSPYDFTYESLAMSHALLSMILPAMSCIVAHVCLRLVADRRHAPSVSRGDHQRYRGSRPDCAGRGVTQSRWIHLGFRDPANSCSTQRLVDTDVTPNAAVTATPVADVTEAATGRHASSFLDRLYSMIKSREFVLSIVYVRDSRLADLPPSELAGDFNAMASVVALFFVFLILPQILFMAAACTLRESTDWSVLKNIGLAVDLISNNRVNFTLFLYMLVSGRRVSDLLLRVLSTFLGFCCPCVSSRSPVPAGRVEMVLTEVNVQGHGQGHGHGQGQTEVNGRLHEGGQGRLSGGEGVPRCHAGGVGILKGQGQLVSVEDGRGDNKMPKISIMTPC